jgi:hypothetical protein
MSRSHPSKRKPRTTRATALIVCEGFTEEAFCKYLKSLYARDCGVSVSTINARGGSPQDIIQLALRHTDYDRVLLFLDADRTAPESLIKKSRGAGHYHVISEPCVEGFFLSLLNRPVPRTSEECKRAFDGILRGNAKYDARAYAVPYPQSLLDASNHPLLSLLKSAFQPQ